MRISKSYRVLSAAFSLGVIALSFVAAAPVALDAAALSATKGGGSCCSSNSQATNCEIAACGDKHDCISGGANQCDPRTYCTGSACPIGEALTDCAH